MKNPTPLPDRLARYTTPDPSGCWIWTGTCDRHGYGHLKVKGRTLRAHRVSYEVHVGRIPEGKQLDHLCRVRRCINPAHLEPVTSRENTLRSPIADAAVKSRSATCISGHPLSGDNLYVDFKGHRRCRECRRQRTAEWRERKTTAAA